MGKIKKILLSKGFTLVELTIASAILMIILTLVMSVYVNFSSSKRKLLLSTEVYNEARFLMERIVREIQNGTIDYQGYWRENLLNKTADNWIDKTALNNAIYEGVNFFGVSSDSTNPTSWGLNHIKNCKDPSDTSDSAFDTNSEESRKDILYNYRYQFIYPGDPEGSGNTQTDNFIHLNCSSDRFDETDAGGDYNVYDDELAYGRGPRSFDDGDVGYDSQRNYAQASKMLWDWDLTDNGGNPDPKIDNSPPLLLVKSNESKNKFTRTALKYEDNKIKMIRFFSEEDTDNPPDGIVDRWFCEKDFECGTSENSKFNGSYIWSQKEVNKNDVTGDATIGEDNGIGTITDSDLHWKDITPEKIEITHFDFILSPVKDPHRAFYEREKIQKPQVTLIFEVRAKKSAMKGISGLPPKIRIQTTATPRVWDLIEVDN